MAEQEQPLSLGAASWDARYGGQDLVWGKEPNRFVVAELSSASAGRALDVACGEGRNAIWLATRGWRAVGVDFSEAGLARATTLAAEAGVSEMVEFVTADVVDDPLPDGPFDAVVVAYLQVPFAARRAALRKAAAALAPGGVLVVVAHDRTNLTEGVGGPQDPNVLYEPADVVADLESVPGIAIQRAERVRRPVATDSGERHAVDVLVRATTSRPG